MKADAVRFRDEGLQGGVFQPQRPFHLQIPVPLVVDDPHSEGLAATATRPPIFRRPTIPWVLPLSSRLRRIAIHRPFVPRGLQHHESRDGERRTDAVGDAVEYFVGLVVLRNGTSWGDYSTK